MDNRIEKIASDIAQRMNQFPYHMPITASEIAEAILDAEMAADDNETKEMLDAADAYITGYEKGIEEAGRLDLAAIVRENEVLKGRLSVERALHSDACRQLDKAKEDLALAVMRALPTPQPAQAEETK